MAKNLWAKSRPVTNPYATIVSGGWTWKILKAYQARANERKNKYARFFCEVDSPLCQGSPDLGDTYITDIPMTPELAAILAEREKAEEAATCQA